MRREDDDEEEEDAAIEQLTYEAVVEGQSLCSLCSDPRQWRPAGDAAASAHARQSAAAAAADAAAVLRRAKAQSAAQLRDYAATVHRVFAASQQQQQQPMSPPMSPQPPPHCGDDGDEFFAEDFDIKDPATFARALGLPLAHGGDDVSGGAWMAEVAGARLALLLDEVELKIIDEVSRRSAGFFDALDTLERLRAEARAAGAAVGALRLALIGADERAARSAVRVAAVCRRRANVAEVSRRVALLGAVLQARPTVLALLASDDFAAALDVVDRCRAVLSGPLRGVAALRSAEDALRELTAAVETRAHHEFVRIATDAPLVVDDNDDDAAGAAEAARRAAFARVVAAELRLERLPVAVDLWGQVSVAQVSKEAGVFVRERVLEAVDDAQQARLIADSSPSSFGNPSSALSMAVAELSQAEFLEMTGLLCERLVLYSRQAFMVHAVLFSALAGATSMRPNLVAHLQDEAATTLRKVVGSCHDIVAMLINVRSEDTTVSLAELEQLHHAVSHFASEDEELMRECSMQFDSPARGAVIAHARAVLESMHARELKKIVLLLDNENWMQTTVAREFQRIVDTLAGGAEATAAADLGSAPADTVRIGDRRFKVVNSFLMLVKSVESYLKLPSSLRPLAASVAAGISELLHTFHRRVYQLILGAEVTKLLNLKSISAKFLALTAQTLAAVIELVPHIRAALHPFLSDPSEYASLQRLDSVAQDLQSHMAQLFAKLASLVHDRVQALIGDKDAYRSALLAPPPDQCTAPVARLCKEIASLHRVLARYLSPDQIAIVFAQVGEILAADIPEVCARIAPLTDAMAARFTGDTAHIVAVLSSLPDVTQPPSSLVNLVAAPVVPSSSSSSPSQPLAETESPPQ